MIVQELIEQLECCDPESDVLIDGGDVNLIEVDHVDEKIALNIVVIS